MSTHGVESGRSSARQSQRKEEPSRKDSQAKERTSEAGRDSSPQQAPVGLRHQSSFESRPQTRERLGAGSLPRVDTFQDALALRSAAGGAGLQPMALELNNPEPASPVVTAPQVQVAYDGGAEYSPEVEQLQSALVAAGYLSQEDFETGPGYYGEKTRAAVARLQADYRIYGDSGENYGPRTQQALDRALRGDKPPPIGAPGTFTLDDLGSISRRYEGNIGTIANNPGDPGGKSYGAYQFALNVGGVDKFLATIKDEYPDIYETLAQHTPGSDEFDAAWTTLASEQPDRFYAAQHYAAGQAWYVPARDTLDANIPGLDLANRSKAVHDMIWSMGIQHGPGAPGYAGGTLAVFNLALEGKDVSKMTDEELIRAVYQARSDYVSGLDSLSPDIKQACINRYVYELQDALAILANG